MKANASGVVPDEADANDGGAPMTLLRKANVLGILDISERQLDNRLAAGTFPKPVWLGASNPAWLASEVREYILRLKAERDAGIVSPARAAALESRRRGGKTAQAKLRAKKQASNKHAR